MAVGEPVREVHVCAVTHTHIFLYRYLYDIASMASVGKNQAIIMAMTPAGTMF